MTDLECLSPSFIKIFANEPSVALVRLRLGAKEAGTVKDRGGVSVFDLALGHELEKLPLIHAPIHCAFAVLGKHVFRGGEQRLMLISDIADPAEEVSEIGDLREAGQLRTVADAYIDQCADVGGPQPLEEMLGRGFCETYGGHVHGRYPAFLRVSSA